MGLFGGGSTNVQTSVTNVSNVTVAPEIGVAITLDPVQRLVDSITGVQTKQLATVQDVAGGLQVQADAFKAALTQQQMMGLVIAGVSLIAVVMKAWR